MYHLTRKSLVESSDDTDDLVWHTIVAKDVLDCLPINTIKCLFKVSEAHTERHLPFHSLLRNDSEDCDLIGAGTLFPESGLLISEFLVDGFLHPLSTCCTVTGLRVREASLEDSYFNRPGTPWLSKSDLEGGGAGRQ